MTNDQVWWVILHPRGGPRSVEKVFTYYADGWMLGFEDGHFRPLQDFELFPSKALAKASTVVADTKSSMDEQQEALMEAVGNWYAGGIDSKELRFWYDAYTEAKAAYDAESALFLNLQTFEV